LQELLTQNLQPGCQGFIVIPDQTFETYTGHMFTAPAVFPSFALPADHPLVTAARHLLSQALEREVSVTTWQFATDGGHLMEAGVPTIGFAPGDENLAHTTHEHILIEQLLSGCLGNAVLAQELGAHLAGASHRLP
jgi:acetylornithine deacetylase/succinyl-diaminopimelate desuccinylase-like protein